MTKSFAVIAGTFFILLGCSQTRPEPSYKGPGVSYRDLELKDLDEMQALVKKRVDKAQKLINAADGNPDAERDARLELLHALRLILSRPNSDNMVAKLVPDVRREAAEIGSYDDLLEDMTHEGIQAFDSDMNLPVSVQTTFSFLLENLMSELKPEITTDARLRACLEKIRDANIKIPEDVVEERKLKSMYLTESPSIEADRILTEAGFKKGGH